MKFYFYPFDEDAFKAEAVGNFVHTIVFNEVLGEVETTFTREVKFLWKQTCRNNVETDHSIKQLKSSHGHNQIYSWVCKSKSDFQLPAFKLSEGVMSYLKQLLQINSSCPAISRWVRR